LKEHDMSSNRNIRNPQQLRALIQNMGRSIDEARSRRLGPSTSAAPAQQVPAEARYETQAPQPLNPNRAEYPRPGSSNDAPHSSSAVPPVRGANEMFDGGAPRLKARPKRAS
jgi:hypothetical protein